MWDDGQSAAEVVELQFGDIDPVDMDAAFACLEESKQRGCKGRFAGAGATNKADSLSGSDPEADVLEHGREIVGISYDEVGNG